MFHESYGCVLQDFCVDVEVGYFRALSECAEHCVCSAAYAALQIEETFWYESFLEVEQEEVGYVLTYLCCDGVGVFEGACFVGDVAFDYADDAVGIYFDVGFADAVACLGYHDGLAEGVVFYFVDVVYAFAVRAVECVEFHDDAFCGEAAYGWADTACGCEIYVCFVAYLFDGACFDDGPVYFSYVALAYLCGHVGEVVVEVVEAIAVDVLAEVRVCGVGGTEVDGVGIGEFAVATLSSAGTGEDADFERSSCCVFCLCLSGYFCWCALGCACGCESAQADGLSVLDEGCCFGSRNSIEVH